MKKLLTCIVAMTLAISVSSTTALVNKCGRWRNFVDNDNDGVCDYYNTSSPFVDNDGDGICDNYGSNSCGNGAGFVDADNNGICHNYTTNTSQNGSGFKQEHCGGHDRHCK